MTDNISISVENLVRQTDKAILVSIECETGSGKRFAKDVWFPKSQTDLDNDSLSCPAWLVKSKAQDLFGSKQIWFVDAPLAVYNAF